MKNTIYTLLLLTALFAFTGCGYERIDAGHAGIEVDLYGNDKGVQDVTLVTGAVWYNPFTTNVYEVPTYVQNVVYTKDPNEGSENNEEFSVTTKDGMTVDFDVSMNYRTPANNVPQIFKKYRKTPSELGKTIIRNYLREAFNNAASDYTASSLYENRKEFKNKGEDNIKGILEPEGFEIEQVVLLNELRLPPSVKSNIEAKINAEQEALRKEQELASAKADAQKRVATSEGDLEVARNEAEANRLRAQSINDKLLLQEWIKKWNGKLPQVSSGNSMMLDISKLK